MSDGWKEAVIAWSVCASIHREYAKGKDALFSTRQADFVRHEANARTMFEASKSPTDAIDSLYRETDTLRRRIAV
jgi:hypothetical protein